MERAARKKCERRVNNREYSRLQKLWFQFLNTFLDVAAGVSITSSRNKRVPGPYPSPISLQSLLSALRLLRGRNKNVK